MPNSLVLGVRPISIEDVEDVARREARVDFAEPARARIRQGRLKLEERLEAGDRIYGVNTGVGGNVGILARCRSRWKRCSTIWSAIFPAPPASRWRPTWCARPCCCAWPRLPRGSSAVRKELVGAGGAAESRHHAGGAALRIGGRERRPDALGIHCARAGGAWARPISRAAACRPMKRWCRGLWPSCASLPRKAWR